MLKELVRLATFMLPSTLDSINANMYISCHFEIRNVCPNAAMDGTDWV